MLKRLDKIKWFVNMFLIMVVSSSLLYILVDKTSYFT